MDIVKVTTKVDLDAMTRVLKELEELRKGGKK